jgi:hypothetical protein
MVLFLESMAIMSVIRTKVTFHFGDRKVDIEVPENEAFNALEKLLKGSLISHTNADAENFNLKPPNRSEIIDFIKSRPNYSFSVDSISENLMGDKFNDADEKEQKQLLAAIRSKVGRIREEIKMKEGGEWSSYFDGRSKVFKFEKKQTDDETEDSKQDDDINLQEERVEEQAGAESY